MQVTRNSQWTEHSLMHYKTIAERFKIENAVMSSNYFKPLQIEKSILYVLQTYNFIKSIWSTWPYFTSLFFDLS